MSNPTQLRPADTVINLPNMWQQAPEEAATENTALVHGGNDSRCNDRIRSWVIGCVCILLCGTLGVLLPWIVDWTSGNEEQHEHGDRMGIPF